MFTAVHCVCRIKHKKIILLEKKEANITSKEKDNNHCVKVN